MATPRISKITMESPAEFAEPVYLVALRDEEESAYSVLKIDGGGGGDGEPPCARIVAGLPGAERGMSFVAAHSKHGSWIVGVGGALGAGTIIFDPSTLETVKSHRLKYPKHNPVLISHRGEVYAISRRPRVVPPMDSDPWFESLSFNTGVPSWERGAFPCWTVLPPPPFFPISLDPFEFRKPPEITVTSYAAMSSYILLSPQQDLMVGTYAFHVVNKTWSRVHDDNLPFVGQAVPLGVGGGLFAACPISKNGIAASASVFHMSIELSSSSTPFLSIHQFPVVASEDKIPWPLFCPLGKGSFCSIRLGSIHQKKVILTTVQLENIEAILMACQSRGPKAKDVRVAARVMEQSHTYKSKRRYRLLESEMSIVAALSMNAENTELFEEEATAKRASGATESIIFEASVTFG